MSTGTGIPINHRNIQPILPLWYRRPTGRLFLLGFHIALSPFIGL